MYCAACFISVSIFMTFCFHSIRDMQCLHDKTACHIGSQYDSQEVMAIRHWPQAVCVCSKTCNERTRSSIVVGPAASLGCAMPVSEGTYGCPVRISCIIACMLHMHWKSALPPHMSLQCTCTIWLLIFLITRPSHCHGFIAMTGRICLLCFVSVAI